MISQSRLTISSSYSSLPTKQSAILDYILAHADGDERPYLSVKILGVSVQGLLDSGASNSIVGEPGWRILEGLGLQLNHTDQVRCTVANGNSCYSTGYVNVPFCLEDRVITLRVLVIPTLPQVLILGADFWKRMGIVPDLRHGSWKFSSDPSCAAVLTNSVSLHSQTELTAEQLEKLNKLVADAFKNMGDVLGCTTLVEHEIITSSKPIKQRYYPVSPVMQSHMSKELYNLLADSIVEPSSSPWSSPILLVKKTDGSWRFHLKILSEEFSRLKTANLTASKEKCQFCRPELRYLGYTGC
uniref:Peptidase A2 domain-containing protein n=1 Tax=Anoplophora glabripennis TaxID=217634 RepID=V5I9J3_ANOGL